MYEANAEAKVDMQKQRPKQRHRKPAKQAKTDGGRLHKICEHSCPGGHFFMIWGGLGASGVNLEKGVEKGAKKSEALVLLLRGIV